MNYKPLYIFSVSKVSYYLFLVKIKNKFMIEINSEMSGKNLYSKKILHLTKKITWGPEQ